MTIELRPPALADVDRLESIENAADAFFVERFRPEVWWPASPGRERLAGDGFVFVVSENGGGEAVGFVHVLEVDGLAHLEQLSVLPSHGRRGFGRLLVAAALTEAAVRGFPRVTLRTYADVPWNAPFYARSGFKETEPDHPFLLNLLDVEASLGLARYGRRVQMTAGQQ